MAKKPKRELVEDLGSVSVEAVNHGQGVVLVLRGEEPMLLPITNYFDTDGNEVDDSVGASCFVAGDIDCWITVPMDIFETGYLN